MYNRFVIIKETIIIDTLIDICIFIDNILFVKRKVFVIITYIFIHFAILPTCLNFTVFCIYFSTLCLYKYVGIVCTKIAIQISRVTTPIYICF